MLTIRCNRPPLQVELLCMVNACLMFNADNRAANKNEKSRSAELTQYTDETNCVAIRSLQ